MDASLQRHASANRSHFKTSAYLDMSVRQIWKAHVMLDTRGCLSQNLDHKGRQFIILVGGISISCAQPYLSNNVFTDNRYRSDCRSDNGSWLHEFGCDDEYVLLTSHGQNTTINSSYGHEGARTDTRGHRRTSRS
jgi:hypothetical protein